MFVSVDQGETYSQKENTKEKKIYIYIYIYIKDRTTAPIIQYNWDSVKSLLKVSTANRLMGNQVKVVLGNQKEI